MREGCCRRIEVEAGAEAGNLWSVEGMEAVEGMEEVVEMEAEYLCSVEEAEAGNLWSVEEMEAVEGMEEEYLCSVEGAEAEDLSLAVGVTREEEEEEEEEEEVMVEVVVAEEVEDADARIIIYRSFANLGVHEYHSIRGDSGYTIESNKPRHRS